MGSRLGLIFMYTAAVILAGCGDPPPPPAPNSAALKATTRPQRKFIAFVGAGEADPIWPVLKAGSRRYAQQLGTRDIRYYVPKGNSPQDQAQLLQTLDDPLMGGLCIQVTQAEALRSTLDSINQRGVPIISMIRPLSEALRMGHVGFDDTEIGTLLADTTAKVLDDRGTVMLLHAGKKNAIYGDRLSALEKRLEAYPGIEIFAEVDCQMDAVQARRAMRERSERYPRLSAWISIDDWPLQHFGELDSIMPPGCKFITFGGTPMHWPAVREGRCPAIVAANYNDLGANAVQFCETAMHEASRFRNVYNAPLRVVWSSHLDDYVRDWMYWTTGNYPGKRDF